MPARRRIQTSQPAEVSGGTTIIVEDSGVDVEHEDSLALDGDPIIVDLAMPDPADVEDSLADASTDVEDDFALSDPLDLDADVDADDELTFDPAPIITALDMPDPLIFVNEPSTLNPDVADLWHYRPRLGEMLSDVGEVITFLFDVGRGRLQLTGESSNAQFGQIRQESPDTTYGIVTVDGSANEEISASTNSLNPNEHMVVCGWDLRALKGVRWSDTPGYAYGDPFSYCQVRNPAALTARRVDLWAGFLSQSQQSITDPLTWNNAAEVRSQAKDGINGSFDARFGESISANSSTAPFWYMSDFGVNVGSSSLSLWACLWQDANILTAGVVEMFDDWNLDITFRTWT